MNPDSGLWFASTSEPDSRRNGGDHSSKGDNELHHPQHSEDRQPDEEHPTAGRSERHGHASVATADGSPNHYSRAMSTPGEYLRSVVRVFPDYAGTVLWFVPGPVSYEVAHLSPELTSAMKAWEKLFDEYLSYEAPRSGLDEDAWDAEGLRLCRALADELGDLVGVEYHSDREGAKKIVLRGRGQGTNAPARAAFERMIDRSLEEDAEYERMKAQGIIHGSYVPLKSVRPSAQKDGR